MNEVVFTDPQGKPYNKNYQALDIEIPKIDPLPRPDDFDSFQNYLITMQEKAHLIHEYINHYLCPEEVSLFIRRPNNSPFMMKVPKRKQMIPLSDANKSFLHGMMLQDTSIQYDDNMPDNQGPKLSIPVRSVVFEEEPWQCKKIPPFPIPDFYDSFEDFENAVENWYKISNAGDTFPTHPDEITDLEKSESEFNYFTENELPIPEIQHENLLLENQECFQITPAGIQSFDFDGDLESFDSSYDVLSEIHSHFMEYNRPTILLHEFMLDGGTELGINLFKEVQTPNGNFTNNPLVYFKSIHNLALSSQSTLKLIDTTPQTIHFRAMAHKSEFANWSTLFDIFCSLQCIFNHDFQSFSFTVMQNVDMFAISAKLIQSFTGINEQFYVDLTERALQSHYQFDYTTNYALLALIQYHLAGLFDTYIGQKALRPKFKAQITELVKTFAPNYVKDLENNVNQNSASAITLFVLLVLQIDKDSSKLFLKQFKSRFFSFLSNIASVSEQDFYILEQFLLSSTEMVTQLFEHFTLFVLSTNPDVFARLSPPFISFLRNYLNCRFVLKSISSDWVFALCGQLVQNCHKSVFSDLLYILCKFVIRHSKDQKLIFNIMSITITASSKSGMRHEVLDGFASLVKMPKSTNFLKSSTDWLYFVLDHIGSPVETVSVSAAKILKNYGIYHTTLFGILLKKHIAKFDQRLQQVVFTSMPIRASAQIVKMFYRIAERDISVDDVGEQKPGGLIALFYGITDDMIEMVKAFCGAWYKLSEQTLRLKWSKDKRLSEVGKGFENCLKQRSSLRRLIRSAERKGSKPGVQTSSQQK